MRLHRFFVSPEIGEEKEIRVRDSNLWNQLKNVFRFTIGGQVILLDNSGYEYRALISSFDEGDVSFSIVSRRESTNLPAKEVTLFCSVPKKDKFELILEKGTELGISHFVPIVSDRSEKKGLDIERGRRILKEASEQSGRPIVPTLDEVINLEGVLRQDFACLAFHPKGDVFTPEHTHMLNRLGVFIGPEGGWTEREIYLFKKHGVKVYSFGDFTLRTETAALVAATLILVA